MQLGKLMPVFIALSLFYTTGCISLGLGKLGEPDYLRDAEELLRQGQNAQAISKYEQHIKYRLALETRPQWENPYFYYLLIGDIYLRDSNVDKALESYETAENNRVESVLVSDRYRYVANWYEQKGEADNALKILERYQDRDPLLFDAMMDRIAKEIVAREEAAKPR